MAVAEIDCVVSCTTEKMWRNVEVQMRVRGMCHHLIGDVWLDRPT